MSALEHSRRRSDGSRVTRPASSREGAELPEDESADRLLAGLTHNLRNLIQVVSGNLELVGGRTDDELALRYLANAKLAAQLIMELTEGLEAEPPE